VAARECCRGVVEGRDGVCRLVLRAPGQEVGVRQHEPAAVGSVDANVRDSVGVAEWKRFEQDAVHDGENRGGRTDAQGQCEHRDGREARALGKNAERVTDVGKQSSHAAFDGLEDASVGSAFQLAATPYPYASSQRNRDVAITLNATANPSRA